MHSFMHGGFSMISDEVVQEILAGDCLSTTQAARLIPAKKGQSSKLNPATLFRWVTIGCKTPDGRIVKLEAARLGCRYMTSRGAIARFMRALSEQPASMDTPRPRSASARDRAAAAAEKKLIELGC